MRSQPEKVEEAWPTVHNTPAACQPHLQRHAQWQEISPLTCAAKEIQPGGPYLSKTTAAKLGSAKTTSPVLSSLVALRPRPFFPASNSSTLSMFPTVIVLAKQNTGDRDEGDSGWGRDGPRDKGPNKWQGVHTSHQILTRIQEQSPPLSWARPLLQPKINSPPLGVVPPRRAGESRGGSGGRGSLRVSCWVQSPCLGWFLLWYFGPGQLWPSVRGTWQETELLRFSGSPSAGCFFYMYVIKVLIACHFPPDSKP